MVARPHKQKGCDTKDKASKTKRYGTILIPSIFPLLPTSTYQLPVAIFLAKSSKSDVLYKATIRALFHVFLAHLSIPTEVHFNFLRNYRSISKSTKNKLTFSGSWGKYMANMRNVKNWGESCPVVTMSCGTPVPMRKLRLESPGRELGQFLSRECLILSLLSASKIATYKQVEKGRSRGSTSWYHSIRSRTPSFFFSGTVYQVFFLYHTYRPQGRKLQEWFPRIRPGHVVNTAGRAF